MTLKLQIGLAGMVLLAGTVWGQQDTPQTPAPPPAFGQEAPPPSVTIAPPVTSLDEVSLEPAIAARSYLQPGLHLTESVNSNLSQSSGTLAITRLLGSLDLLRVWSRYSFTADYVGGAALYSDDWGNPSQTHALSAGQRYAWRTGRLQARDCLTYLPEGSFGYSGFNGSGGGGLGGGAGCGSFGGSFGGASSFGSLGSNPRLTNAATLDLTESFSPRSSITAAGGYTFTDFVNNHDPGSGNSRQVSGEAGYSRVLNRFDQLGLQYGFEEFQFPRQNAGTIDSHTVQALYEHQVSGRMSLTLGAGPQWIVLHNPGVPATTQLTASARAILRYRFPRNSVALAYTRHTTAGSGIQFGSQTDEVRGTLGRQLTRQWNGTLDAGYSHHRALEAATGNALGGTYQAGFGGGGLTRRLGRFFSLQLHYQYTYEYFAGDACQVVDCSSGHTFNRHIGDITLSWHPAPIRLD